MLSVSIHTFYKFYSTTILNAGAVRLANMNHFGGLCYNEYLLNITIWVGGFCTHVLTLDSMLQFYFIEKIVDVEHLQGKIFK